jgi:hypothetical protein
MTGMTLAAIQIATWTWWMEPCADRRTGCLPEDRELAEWSLAEWSKASNGALRFQPVKDEKTARLRFYWSGTRPGLYGEAMPFDFDGKRGAKIYLRPTVTSTPDPLLRDVIVYLTCLHESGHAIGLGHTSDFDDIMYSFQFGGDLDEYFARHRRKLTARNQIRTLGGTSPGDVKQLSLVIRYRNAF